MDARAPKINIKLYQNIVCPFENLIFYQKWPILWKYRLLVSSNLPFIFLLNNTKDIFFGILRCNRLHVHHLEVPINIKGTLLVSVHIVFYAKQFTFQLRLRLQDMRIKDMPRRKKEEKVKKCILKLYFPSFSSPSLMITFRSLVSWIINNIILMLYTKTAKCKYAITTLKWRTFFYLNICIFQRSIRCWHGKLIN